jgi:hypothetical protein
MSCDPKFTNDVSLSCVFSLIADFRNGASVQTIKKTLWLAGCLMERTGVPVLPTLPSLPGIMAEPTIESVLDQLEAVAYELDCPSGQTASTLASPDVSVQGWEVLIPILFELVKLWWENRKKKQEPAPTPAPSPTPAISPEGSGVVKAPKK